MLSTPASLLERLRKPNEAAAWDRFVELYSPLLFHWAKRLGLQDSDAADLVQDVFLLLVRKLPQFEYDGQKCFRAWLKTVFTNKWRERRRLRQPATGDVSPDEIAEPSPNDVLEEQEYRRFLTQRALLM